MEAELVSEKRKRSSYSLAPSSIAISTKSKSRIQLCNSSDSSPIDSTARLNQESNLRRPESPRKRPKSRYGDPASSKGYVLFHTLTKDLRSRRVYSPKSDPTQNLGFEFGCDELEGKATEMEGSEIVSKKATMGEQIEKLGVGFPYRSKGVDGSDEDYAQIRPPPDAGMYAVPWVGKPSSGNSQSEGCVREAFGARGDMKIDSEPKSKSFIRPCSQRKVFRTPGSFSYRRLLPYLMDISKSNSCVPEINLRNLDKGPSERKLVVRCLSQSEEASKENCERDIISMECQISHSDASQKLVLDYAHELSSCDKPSVSDNTTELPSITLVDGSSLPPMNRHAQNSDAGLSCNDQIMNNLDCYVSVAVEELQVVKDDVISPSFDDIKVVENVETEEADSAFHLGKDNEVNQYSENSGQVGCEGMKDTDRLHPLKVQELNQLKEQRGGGDGQVVNQVADANEESIQMTPPEAVISSKPEVEGNGVDRADCILQDKDHCPGNLSNGIDHRNAGLDYNVKHDYNSKCQVSLKPRSRSKLFRSPGSFSYRRLLPFLMNIAKDNSDASVNDLKPEKDLEFPSLSASENQEIPFEKSNGIRLEENQKGDSGSLPMSESTAASDSSKDGPSKLISPGHGTELQISINSQKEEQMQVEEAVSNLPSELETFPDISSSQISFNSKKEDLMQVDEAVPNIPSELLASPDISSSQISFNSQKEELMQVEEAVPNIASELVASPDISSSQISFNSQKEEIMQVEDAVPNIPSELETSPDILISADETGQSVTSLCSVDCEPSPREELAISTSNQLPVETEMNASRSDLESSDGVKSAEADRLCSITIRHESPVSSGSPDVGLRKGILKRNPRGCRGICTCLNCASFKLHAERAFEFSTNQMEDAEEMVLELIKGLSALRNVLEKSTGTADDHLVVPASQAKEACRKASEVEELAKNRLNQLNEDLSIHCRIPCVEPPRVRFANSVEEHVIPRKIYRATRRNISGRTRELQN
ncbi:hypothetical protein UlMin_010429 [Ulmus minor]